MIVENAKLASSPGVVRAVYGQATRTILVGKQRSRLEKALMLPSVIGK
jgi:hypothetical protein